MKRSDLAQAQQSLRELQQINASTLDNLVTILENAFSAIATADPVMALSIMDILNSQRGEIESVRDEREENAAEFVSRLVKAMPASIEFQDEDDNEDMN